MSEPTPLDEPSNAIAVDSAAIRFPDFRYHFASNGILLAKPDGRSEVYVYKPFLVALTGGYVAPVQIESAEINFALEESRLLK